MNRLWLELGCKPGGLLLARRSLETSPSGGALTYECVEYLAKTCNPNHILYNFCKTALIPDEMFFQTLLMHSEFKNTIENNNLRYIDWDSGPEYPRCLRSAKY